MSPSVDRLTQPCARLAKIESASEWHSGELDMREVVEDSITAVSQLFKDGNIALELNAPPQVPSIVADRDRLMQVMLNLLSNAAKFCERPDGRVSVSLSRQGEELSVSVADNGIGLSEADQEVIFASSAQLGDTLTHKHTARPGSRHLGQSPAFRLSGCGSRPPGEGSTFSFTLPVQTGLRSRVPGPDLQQRFGS